MAVETGQAILTAIRVRLQADSTLQVAIGKTVAAPASVYRGPDLPNNPVLPYFWHRLAFRSELLHGVHNYFLDLYWYGVDFATPDAAIDRVKVLLHEWRFTTADSEAQSVLQWFSGDYISTGDPLVMHYATQWVVGIGAARDITNIVG